LLNGKDTGVEIPQVWLNELQAHARVSCKVWHLRRISTECH